MKSFSPQVKFEIISKYLKGGISVYAICREYGVSKVTFYNWLSLYKNSRKNREQVFASKVRFGKFHPKSLNSIQRMAVLRLVHHHPEFSCHKIAEALALGNHGVENFLKICGLNKYEDRLAFSKKPFWKRESAQRREAMFDLLKNGWGVNDICLHFNISKPIFYKWKKRWEEAREGGKLAALTDRYVTGVSHHNYIKEGNKRQVVELVKSNPELSVHKLYAEINKEALRLLRLHSVQVRSGSTILPTSGSTIGHKTIQNVLAREDLNTYEKRLRFAQGYSQVPEAATAPLYIPDMPLYKLRHLIAHFATVPKLIFTHPKRGLPRALVYLSTLVLLFLWIRLLFTTPYATPVGLFFASIALFFGLFFFIYSMKYYIMVLLVLKLAQGGSSSAKASEDKGAGGLWRLGFLGRLGMKLFGLEHKAEGKAVNPLTLNLDKITLKNFPFVSIHVALYNERRVVERLIRACESQEYYEGTIDNSPFDSSQGKQLTIDQEGKESTVNGHPFDELRMTLSIPKGQLSTVGSAAYEVIIVDDSTDETTDMAKQLLSSQGRILDRVRMDSEMEIYVSSPPVGSSLPVIKLIHRFSRSGFKGAALQKALENTNPKAMYISVFDADFVPYPDTIEQFVKTFQELNANNDANVNTANVSEYSHKLASQNSLTNSHSNIAAVQGYQWHVLNKSQTWITRGVRTEYAGSYVIERAGEEIYGGLKQIAGSVYAIRADILRQFGWGTSITEDFELTLRLYEAGYKVAFTPYIQAPAEAVSTIKRLVRQRMRWAEGASYNIKIMLPRLLWGRWEDHSSETIDHIHESTPSVIARNEMTKQSDEEIATSLDELGTRNDNESGSDKAARVWVQSRLTRTEKLEFAYLAPYYLQAAFFVVGTFSWFISEAILGSRLPFWTAALGWSLVFTNILALPLMNIVGLFLEESDERDYIGVLSFIVLSYIVVPFQAYAAIKGFIEKKEGPWFRTPKTGLITDTFTPWKFYRYTLKIFGKQSKPAAENAGFPMATRAFANPNFAVHTANQFNSFTEASKASKLKSSRFVVRAALAFCFAVIFLTINLVQLEESGKHNVNFLNVLDLSAQKGEKLVSQKKIYSYNEKPTFILNVGNQITSSRQKSKLPFLSFQNVNAYAQGAEVQAKVTYRDTPVETRANVIRGDDGQYQIQIERPQQFRPGKYTLEAEYLGQKFHQDFRWGVIAMNTTKSLYAPGEQVKFVFGVVDDLGRTICNAKLALAITIPSENKTYTLTSENGQIQPNPSCSAKSATNTPDYFATFETKNVEEVYQLHLEVETYNGKRETDDMLKITKDIPFEVERTEYPTRVYPMAVYPLEIVIKPQQDFKGEIKDFLPEGFEVIEISDAGIFNNGTILWKVNWKKDNQYTLKYTVAFPQVSPAFYQIGPLTFLPSGETSSLFQEARQWQIAADAIAHVQSANASQANSPTCVVSYASNVTAGSLLVASIRIGDDTSSVTSVTDTRSNTWNLAVGPIRGNSITAYTYYAMNTPSGADTVTFNMDASPSSERCAVSEYSGVATSNALDKTNSKINTNTTSHDTNNITTTISNEVLYAFYAVGSGQDLTWTAGSCTNTCTIRTSTTKLAVEDQIATATGTYSNPITSTASTDDTNGLISSYADTAVPENWVVLLMISPVLFAGLRYLKRRTLP